MLIKTFIILGTKLEQRFVHSGSNSTNQENEEMVPHGRPLRLPSHFEVQGRKVFKLLLKHIENLTLTSERWLRSWSSRSWVCSSYPGWASFSAWLKSGCRNSLNWQHQLTSLSDMMMGSFLHTAWKTLGSRIAHFLHLTILAILTSKSRKFRTNIVSDYINKRVTLFRWR